MRGLEHALQTMTVWGEVLAAAIDLRRIEPVCICPCPQKISLLISYVVGPRPQPSKWGNCQLGGFCLLGGSGGSTKATALVPGTISAAVLEDGTMTLE